MVTQTTVRQQSLSLVDSTQVILFNQKYLSFFSVNHMNLIILPSFYKVYQQKIPSVVEASQQTHCFYILNPFWHKTKTFQYHTKWAKTITEHSYFPEKKVCLHIEWATLIRTKNEVFSCPNLVSNSFFCVLLFSWHLITSVLDLNLGYGTWKRFLVFAVFHH